MTSWIVNVTGLGLGSMRRSVTPALLLKDIKLFDRFRIKERKKYTRADYEKLRETHRKLHEKIFGSKKD